MGNTESIKMEVNSCFVKKHEFWVKHKRGKNWIAHVTGLDRTYGYKREFLQMVKMGRESTFQLGDFMIGEVYEVCSEYYTTSGKKTTNLRGTYLCKEITETHILLECISEQEVIQRFSEESNTVVAKTLVYQLLRVVGPQEAKVLVDNMSQEVVCSG
jgi:hypothetical protein